MRKGIFDGLTNLNELNLDYNKLEKIDSNTFERLINLEILSLQDNIIEEIEERSFESLKYLKELNLKFNRLKRIDFNTFHGLTKIETLSLPIKAFLTKIVARSYNIQEFWFNLVRIFEKSMKNLFTIRYW